MNTAAQSTDGSLGVVVIGRNEARHLSRVLASVGPEASTVVYVDSASTDGSPERVRTEFPNVHVVELRPDQPLSPALGRNTGFAELERTLPQLRLVMFVDGDCELAPGWLAAGRAFLEAHPDVGIVCGRLRERDRERNAYHRLADMEWDQPPGEIEESGGIMMVRAEAWRSAGGQNPFMPAGEEKEFFRRVLTAGWRAFRLADDMAFHDIDMAHFADWWTRNVRTGHSWAHGLWIHGDRGNLRQVASIGLWGVAVPGVALGAALPTLGLSLSVLFAYRRLYRQVERQRLEQGSEPGDARLYAAATVAGKWAGAVGVARFFLKTLPSGRGGRRPTRG